MDGGGGDMNETGRQKKRGKRGGKNGVLGNCEENGMDV
jgi:hypothetical protein